MQYYMTAEEKANEWNITPRHVQYLCRMGRIEGSVKRAGAWFIPDNAPAPNKNMKSTASGFKFVGTRKKIFECAVRLFMLNGYSSVSLKDIADCAGIKQSTIYNHFESKQDILDTIYNYYCHYYLKDRPSLSDMEPIIREGSLIEIMERISYDFDESYRQSMSDITKIIYQRIGIDERARDIARNQSIDEGIRYVESIFDRTVEIGRLAPFDTHAIAIIINSIRMFTLFNWILDSSPENMSHIAEAEKFLFEYAANYLIDLKAEA